MRKHLVAVKAASAISFGATNAYAANLTGAGSTWVYPLTGEVGGRLRTRKRATNVNYQSIGSGGGIKQIEGGTVAFGASDMPLNAGRPRQGQWLMQFPHGHRRRGLGLQSARHRARRDLF